MTHRFEQPIALGMPEAVVDALEIVAVDIGQAEARPIAQVSRDFALEHFIKALAVLDVGQQIDTCSAMLPLEKTAELRGQKYRDAVSEKQVGLRLKEKRPRRIGMPLHHAHCDLTSER